MERKMKMNKMNSCYKDGAYHVGHTNMWGNYCPETGEYYLACKDADPIVGDCIGVLASAREMADGSWQEQSACGYTYEVVRELLQLGHLTAKTLETFLAMDGEVWWNQPNF